MAGTELAKAYVQIIPSAEGIKGKLTNVLGGEAEGAGRSAGKSIGSSLVSSIKSIIAAAGIGTALKAALTEGSELQQLQGGVKKIFDEMDTSTIMADAANAYKNMNMSANQYLSTINDVGATFAATMGDEKGYSVAKTGLQAISDYASGTGKNVDLLSEKFTMITRSTSSYQSIADQFSGILPATSDGFLEQAQAAGFLAGKYKKLTEVPVDEYQQAVSEMLKKGTEDLGLTGNTAAETATTFSGSLAAMKAAAQNVLGNLALGESIGPSLSALGETFFTFVSGNLMPMAGNILSSLPEVLDGAFSIAIQGLNLLESNIDTITQMGVELVTGLGISLVSALPYLAEAAVGIAVALGESLLNTDWAGIASDLISTLSTNLSSASSNIFGSDSSIIDAVLASITTNLPSVLAKGSEILLSIVNGILTSIPSIIESAGQIVTTFTEFLAENGPVILETGVDLLLSLVDGIIRSLPEIASSAINTISNLTGTLLKHAPKLLETGIALLGKLAAGLISAIPNLISKLPQIIEQIKSKFSSVDWGTVGKNIISGVAKGITNGISSIVSAAKNAANKALKAAKNALGIKSPSRVFENEVGKMIDMGLAEGIENNVSAVTSSMKELSRSTVGMVDTDFSMSLNRTFSSANRADKSNITLEQLYEFIVEYLPKLANLKVVTNTGTLIGELLPGMNLGLSDIQELIERNVCT